MAALRAFSFLLVLCFSGCSSALKINVGRRQLCAGALTAMTPLAAHAAEPIPIPVLTPEEEAARMARKMEALKKQDRRGKADAKVLFGSDYQAGKREVRKEKPQEQQGSFSMPILLPGDVGGINLGMNK